jgi:hypothetical protein
MLKCVLQETDMAASDIFMLTLVTVALTAFAGVLAWASWRETRARNRRSP